MCGSEVTRAETRNRRYLQFEPIYFVGQKVDICFSNFLTGKKKNAFVK